MLSYTQNSFMSQTQSGVNYTQNRELSAFIADMQQIKDNWPLSTAIYNTRGEEFMGFVQTGDMLELYKRNNDSGILITLMEHGKDEDGFKTKYGMHSLVITGVDQELGNVLTFGLGMCSHKSTISLWWILNKFIEKCNMVKRPIKVVWAPLDKKLFGMLEKELPHECKIFAT